MAKTVRPYRGMRLSDKLQPDNRELYFQEWKYMCGMWVALVMDMRAMHLHAWDWLEPTSSEVLSHACARLVPPEVVPCEL